MKIALVSGSSFYHYGGIQNHILGLYKYLKSRGHEVKIIAPKYRNEKKFMKDLIFIGDCKRITSNASLTDISFISKKYNTKKILEKERFDIIHIHNPNLFISTEILSKSNSKNIMTLHVLPNASILFNIIKFFLNYFKNNGLFKKIDGVIFVSKPVKDCLGKYFSCKKVVIPNGIDIKNFLKKKIIKKYKDGKINLLFLGRIEKRKGLIYLLKAFKVLKEKHENLRLIVVGTGNLEKKCKKYVYKNKIKDVVFVGPVDEEKKIAYLNVCDIFCAPSIYGESFGIVLLEAMACGKPIVGFANDGYKVVLNKQQKKFLVKPKDVSGLVKKIDYLIKNKHIREYIGRIGKEEAKKYDWSIVGEKIESFYREILNEK